MKIHHLLISLFFFIWCLTLTILHSTVFYEDTHNSGFTVGINFVGSIIHLIILIFCIKEMLYEKKYRTDNTEKEED